MWVLALDTTTRAGSAALVRDDQVIVERTGDGARTHAERLPQELEAVLAEAGIGPAAIDLFAVASGPGAFTGLRIGLAAVQGLALALDRPVAAVSALQAHAWLALLARPEAVRAGVWLDASRGEVFAALYGRPAGGDWPLVEWQPPLAAAPADVLRAWGAVEGLAVVGEGARRCAALLRAARLQPGDDVPVLGGAIGRLGRRLHLAGASGPPHAVQPLYIRRPDVELERERAAPR
jgi:tRNA threonylcarbamoyladenosine biosynthesis protein TsaB